jgi:uncharacterized protein (TIGR02594 family)
MIGTPGAPPWLLVAQLEEALHVKEIPGGAHEDRIIMYHDHTNLDAETDEVPWCSSFVNYCVTTCGVDLKTTRSARARSWLRWGVGLGYPCLGCIVVLKRGGSNQPGPDVINAQGHVGFFVGYQETAQGHISVLGGNQSDRVCTFAYPADRVLGYRWAA